MLEIFCDTLMTGILQKLFLALSAGFLLVITSQARLIAQYDFCDGDLLDNEVSASEYQLERRIIPAGSMSTVMLNRASGTAVFPGGMDSTTWLECVGPGRVTEFTVSFWLKTDVIDQRMTYLGVVSSGRRGEIGSWQLHSDTRRQGNLCFRSGTSQSVTAISDCMTVEDRWYHVLLRKELSGALVFYVTPETDTISGPSFRLDRSDVALDEIILGAACERKTGYRMELANVKIYDSVDVPVSALFAEGPTRRAPAKPALWAITDTLNRLRADAVEIRSILSHLPALEDTLQLNAYGCHSSYLPAMETVPEEPRWTVSLFGDGTRVKEIYLVPAADRRVPSMPGYGFPPRFRIVGRLENGTSSILADWRDRDFPDPGRLPVRLIVPYGKYLELRLEVFRGCEEAGKEFFALDEMLMRSESNLTRFDHPIISAGFEAPPFWSVNYLIDGKNSMGLPVLPELDGMVPDYVAGFSRPQAEPVVVELDLGTNRWCSDVVFYPAQPPEGLAIPGYGFPGSVKMEFFRDRAGELPRKLVKEYPAQKMKNPGNNIIRRFSRVRQARWLRFTFDQLPQYEGRSVFGLGEIEVTTERESVAVGCLVESDSLPTNTDLQLLADGVAGGRKVIPVLQWLDSLSLRRDLNRWLAKNEELQQVLVARKARFWSKVLVSCVSALVVVLASSTVIGAMLRRRHSARFRQRVTQDLHDDIGSKIGAISLASTYLRRAVPDRLAQACGQDIEEIATDMKKALGDVLWFTNSQTDRLRELVCKLTEIAEYTIPSDMLEMTHTALRDIPDHPIRVEMKRDLMMLFKEALHNAAKHADASLIGITIRWTRPYLYLCIRDNGKGFNVRKEQNERSQLGLSGMRRRAKRLRADFWIQSEPGNGTVIELTMKVRR